MGICGSNDLDPDQKQRLAEEKKKNKFITNDMKQKKYDDEGVKKLLLLGAGESGKSTLFKQMIMIYGTEDEKKLTDAQRRLYIPLIIGNIYQSALALADASAQWGPPTTVEGQTAIEYINDESDDQLSPETARILAAFWADPGIQICYTNRAKFQLNDSTKYFMDKVQEISNENWIPSTEDILRTRVRTTGIVEHKFVIDEEQFRMFDVGGQRNERKKWIHCFENVTAVLFVAAISEFDQLVFEDDLTNRMAEARNLFSNICDSEWFKNTSIILFLNKMDIFMEKIKTTKITDSDCPELQEFKGDTTSFEETSEFIKNNVFLKTAKKKVYAYVTCATNTQNVNIVFDTVKESIINEMLEQAGIG